VCVCVHIRTTTALSDVGPTFTRYHTPTETKTGPRNRRFFFFYSCCRGRRRCARASFLPFLCSPRSLFARRVVFVPWVGTESRESCAFSPFGLSKLHRAQTRRAYFSPFARYYYSFFFRLIYGPGFVIFHPIFAITMSTSGDAQTRWLSTITNINSEGLWFYVYFGNFPDKKR